MDDDMVVQLPPMNISYTLCTCENDDPSIENEAVCSSEKQISCDIVPSKPYQKNTCYAKRRRRSLQERLSYIPNNLVKHHNRIKVCHS